MSKRLAIAAIAGLTAFGAVTASAATLGGLNSASIGADTTVVAACDNDGVNVSYDTAYDVAAKEYRVSAVNLSGIADACQDQAVTLTLANASAALGSASGTVSGTAQKLQLAAPVAAKAVTSAAIVITG